MGNFPLIYFYFNHPILGKFPNIPTIHPILFQPPHIFQDKNNFYDITDFHLTQYA